MKKLTLLIAGAMMMTAGVYAAEAAVNWVIAKREARTAYHERWLAAHKCEHIGFYGGGGSKYYRCDERVLVKESEIGSYE